jgi:threonyl-tRNA synthetase
MSLKPKQSGKTGLEIVEKEFPDQKQQIVAARVNGEIVDLSRTIPKDATVELITVDEPEGLEVFRHSSAHLLAEAIMQLYPKAKLTIGPVVEEGFYYDVDMDTIQPEDFKAIERKMYEIRKKNEVIERKEITLDEAQEMFKDNKYKLELIKEHGGDDQGDSKKGGKLTIYQQGEFFDLCRGPHLPRLGLIKAFKLTKAAGAYWRADAKNKQLQRIYGISFPEKEQLKEYVKNLEEAEKRDHRKLGQQLDLFSFNDISPGSPFFHPKGALIYIELQNYLRSLYKDWGYSEVITPLIYDKSLWEQSGHWKNYQENMFLLKMDGKEASLKPMNCPSHILIYKSQTRSYNDLPLRLTDFAPLHRNELRGTLGGLTRVRKFSQDDCHVFCTPKQIKEEIKSHIEHVRFIYEKIFGFEFSVELSTRPEKSMGSKEQWDEAEESLKKALETAKCKYTLNEGDGAFYGPKIDFHIKDCLGRSWQCATEQLDFQMPDNFDIQYEGDDGKRHRAVMLHRTVLGSMERFMAILIEHFTGKFPLWLSPVQVRVVTVSNKFDSFAEDVVKKLEEHDIRVDFDNSPNPLPKKVRNAQLEKIPLVITIGEKEVTEQVLAVRTLDGKVSYGMKIPDFIQMVLAHISGKAIEIGL